MAGECIGGPLVARRCGRWAAVVAGKNWEDGGEEKID